MNQNARVGIRDAETSACDAVGARGEGEEDGGALVTTGRWVFSYEGRDLGKGAEV